MAGGKETPRQKMIGMMYLVLTALLALNVSKSILDAFVAIEENTQKSNIAQLDRGDGFFKDVSGEIKTTPNNAENQGKLKKLKAVEAQMIAVDKITAKMIESIDLIKLDILEKSGENIKDVKLNDENTIIWRKYLKSDPIRPTRMNLMAVQAKDQYDVPMHEIVGEDIKNPTGSGKKLWADFNKYRSDLVKTVGTYDKFSINPKAINDYKSNEDLRNKVKAEIAKSKADVKEDGQVLQDIYINLTKAERSKVHDMEGIHWMGATFDHSPLVAAIASLSSMQQDILSARALALAHLKSKVTTGEYSFNKIVGLAYGPSFANSGEEVEVAVMMAAFDSDNNPTVTYGGSSFIGENGQGIVKANVSGGELVMSGTVSIKNKSGVKKTEPWTHTVKVVKPSGAISLPELNVLYRGYNNVVTAVASGFDQTNLTGSGVSLTKSGQGWIAKPGSGKEATLTVSGTNSITKKSSTLLTQKFRVMNLPNPELYWGGSANGEKGSRTATTLFAKYGPGIPLNATFNVISWECQIPGAPGAPPKGSGSNISAASSLIGQARPGMNVGFMCVVVGPDGIQRKLGGSYKL